MFKSSLKSLPLALVLTAALNGPAIYHSAVDWWTAPTQLELGDWTKIVACDDCGAVNDGSICRKCGGECFSEKKGQNLFEASWQCSHEGGCANTTNGYLFPDGTYTLDPGYWRLPNGEEVRS